MKLFILTQTFNREYAVKKLINQIKNQTYKDYQLIIVDHGTIKANIKSEDKITVIYADSSFWYTRATNYGIYYILNNYIINKEDRLLIINDDVLFTKKYIEHSISSIKGNDEIYGSICLNISTNKIVHANMKLNKFKGTLNYLNKDKHIDEVKENYLETDVLKGRGMLLPFKVFHDIGFFSMKLPHYRSDHEFTYRAKKYGYKLYISKYMVLFSDLNSPYKFKKGEPWKNIINVFFGMKSTKNWKDLFYYSYLCYNIPYGTYFFIINIARDIFNYIKILFCK